MTHDTQAVSPVIGTILMVAIAVMLAAGVYVWVTVFDTGQSSPEQIRLRSLAIDTDENGQTDWIRITMTAADDPPYSYSVIRTEVLDPAGGLHTQLCSSPSTNGTGCASPVDDSDAWEVGQSTYLPCQGDGAHLVTITVRGSTVIDDTLRCDEASS